jgi:uncharacterized membrane protein YjgN (DUF898 family)
MEEILRTTTTYQLKFDGKGSEFFSVIIVNWLLTILTLGFYYPWAKARKLQFLYGETSLNGESFSFHGTGKELFKGFLKAILIIALLFGLFSLLFYFKFPILSIVVLYLGILALLPFAIHGSYRYRMSRTSWRGIRFGYRGDRKEFSLNFFKWLFLTIITFGIYSSWMSINMRKYILSNIRFGDIEFNSEGDGGDYFMLNLKGYLLSVCTLGIYAFWWQRDLFEYYINNLSMNKQDKEITLNSTVTGGGFFSLAIVNLFIIIGTLGIGYSWVVTRTMKYIFENIEMEGNIDLNFLLQTEENYKDATGEDVGDFLDMDFVM